MRARIFVASGIAVLSLAAGALPAMANDHTGHGATVVDPRVSQFQSSSFATMSKATTGLSDGVILSAESLRPKASRKQAAIAAANATANQPTRATKSVAKPEARKSVSVVRRAALTPGLTATTLVLPLTDGIADTTQVTVVTPVLSPDTALSGNATFVIRSTDGTSVVRTFTAVASSRRTVDGTDWCDPDYLPDGWQYLCSEVQDVWTFVWDGKDDGSVGVIAGDYPLENQTASSAVGALQVRDLELTSVTSTPLGPLKIVIGSTPSLDVTVRGLAYGSPMATTGFVEMTNVAGDVVLDRFDFTDPTNDHPVHLEGYAVGSYVLHVDLEANGVHKTTLINLSVVNAAMITATLKVNSSAFFPWTDGYRDSITFTVGGSTTAGKPIPVNGYVDILLGGRIMKSIRLTRSDASFVWNGRISGRIVAAGVWTARSRLKGPYGVQRTSSPVSITVKNTGVSSAQVTSTLGTVFPVRDGYRDTVVVRAVVGSSTGQSMRATGTIAVLAGSRVVKSMAITRSGTTSLTWNGRIGSSVQGGTYTLRVTVHGPQGITVVKTRTISVSTKHLVNVTTSGSKTVTASYARDDCGGYGYTSCEDGYTYDIGGTSYSSVTRYYNNGSGDIIWSAHSIPVPKGTTSYRFRVIAWTTFAQYVVFRCSGDASDPSASNCPSGAARKFPLSDYTGGTYDAGWSSLGAGDGYVDFAIASSDWGSIYIARYIIDYKVTKKVLQ